MNLTWWLAIAPEIALVVLLFIVLLYHRLVKPDEHRRAGLFTAWGAFVTLLLTLGIWFFGNEPSSEPVLIWGGMLRHDGVTLVFRVMFQSALMLVSLISMDTKFPAKE